MHLATGWLGYCLNIHPTQSFDDVVAALVGPVRAVKQRVCPDRPFAVGLRLAAEAAAEPDAAHRLAEIFARENYHAYTMNGFPYGRFHGAPVKKTAYAPDWTEEPRREYTHNLARIMAHLITPGATATISTVPGGFGPALADRHADVAAGLLRSVADLVILAEETGRTVALALEPEPWCLLDTVRDAIDFFQTHLFTPEAARTLARMTGLDPDAAMAALPRHLGLCLDVCHMAVGFEEPAPTLAALAGAGIPIHKLQLSAAVRVDRMDAAARISLAAFNDPIYLHQVVTRTSDGRVRRFLDLPDALADPVADDAEWRVHFHVPLCADPAPPLASTRDTLAAILRLHRVQPITTHLEIETYTWDVLPPELTGAAAGSENAMPTIVESIEKEFQWVIQNLG